jgi:predicted dehydrogenase
VLLDKPIGMTLPQAQQLAGVIADAGVISQVVLTNRYLPAMRQFLTESAGFVAHGGSATFLGGGAMEGHYFGTPWRLEQGGLIDLGPHVLDSLDAALGTIIDITAVGDPMGTVVLNCRHQNGVVSSAVMSGTTPVEPSGLRIELYGRSGRLSLDTGWPDPEETGRQFGAAMASIASEFAHAVRTGEPHPLDAQRGLHLQRLIQMATDSLAAAGN